MAEEASVPTAVDAAKPVEEPTRPSDAMEGVVASGSKPVDGGDVAPAVDAGEAPKTEAAAADQEAKDEAAADAKPDTTATGVAGDAAASAAPAATNGTPAPSKKANNNGRRKSTGAAVPEHKKKTPSKKKKAPEMHLDTQPGDMWMVAMRGYQPWPVIVCDEDMLPDTLISKRPVSAKRIDGTYREDFLEGGKNVKDRRYPIMFLGTNEFTWQVNTELLPFDIEDVKKQVDLGNHQKKNKALWEAYTIAAEGHDLQWFKDMLAQHEQAVAAESEAKSAKDEEKQKKADKAAKRKSAAAAGDEDVKMEEADDDAAPSAKKAKGSKKRKKSDESDGEPEKPAKTPKTKLKLTNKPKDAASATKSKKESKPKATEGEDLEASQYQKPLGMSDQEWQETRQKRILYLRHRLQKGFLTRDQPPKDEDMPGMEGHMKQLEGWGELDAEILKNTKVHKVLKGILKLSAIPREEEFKFKDRCSQMLAKWSPALSTDAEPAAEASATTPTVPVTNGVKQEGVTKIDAPMADKPEETATASEPAKPTDVDGDVPMTEPQAETKAEGALTAAEPVAG